MPDQIDEPELDQVAEGGALVGVEEDVTLPLRRVVDVDRLGRDVEVAANEELPVGARVRLELGRASCRERVLRLV